MPLLKTKIVTVTAILLTALSLSVSAHVEHHHLTANHLTNNHLTTKSTEAVTHLVTTNSSAPKSFSVAKTQENKAISPTRTRPRLRKHSANQSKPLSLVPADQYAEQQPIITINVKQGLRIIKSNDIPAHKVGAFPNRGNPHKIKAQQYYYELPIKPALSNNITPLTRGQFAIGVNGVVFEPGAAEYYQGIRGGWRYEALGGAVRLGLDENHAHVQPSGMYHYHGIPTGLLTKLNTTAQQSSPIIAWAADGFPVYALRYTTSSGKTINQTSSYVVKSGARPSGKVDPGGSYDGTFVQDYQYQQGAGTLDECNGTFIKNSDFPDGSYAYFLTKNWPVIPRCFKGKPNPAFLKKGRNR